MEYPADEERSHRCDTGRIIASFETTDEGRRHGLIVGEGEHQGGVDMDPGGDERLDSGNPGLGGRNLDHQIRSIHGLPQAPSLSLCSRGVVGEVGRDLEGNKAIAPER